MNYRIIEEHKIDRALFRGFNRRQEVTLCRRRKGGEWVIEPDPFVDDWSEEDYRELIGHMKDLSLRGGFVYGAMQSNVLKGFVTVDAKALGPDNEYLDLRDLFVSADARARHWPRTFPGSSPMGAKQRRVQTLPLDTFGHRNPGVLQGYGLR